MEHSLSSLAFRGSVSDAIAEAKQQKKLFVVYIAGNNPDSEQLETSTWSDPKVSETLTKYCILLHILEGSPEALNFSAIYPHNSAPCITVIGYSGVQLWQKEGFVAADVLISSFEKAWLSLHLQETTAAFLTAALAGKQNASGTSDTAPSDQEVPGTYASSSSLVDDRVVSHSGQPSNLEQKEERNSHEDVPKERDYVRDDEPFPKSSHANVLDESTSISETVSEPEVARPVPANKRNSLDNHLGDTIEVSQKNGQEPSKVAHYSDEVSQRNGDKLSEAARFNTDETKELEKADVLESCATKLDDVFLNIKLPDGHSLQRKFSVTDTLRMVKDYINENQTSSLGSFNLAIPYPRRVFTDQDLVSTLSELGFYNRQALVVVPHNKTNLQYGGGSSVRNQTTSSDDIPSSERSEGYWASLKSILSYFNPFSYVAGASSSSAVQESRSGPWQYGPNSSPQSNMSVGRSYTVHSSEQNRPETVSGRNSGGSRSKQPTRFGANIHTLKHDEDDSRFKDRNAFWNGNSTQFGGDNDGK